MIVEYSIVISVFFLFYILITLKRILDRLESILYKLDQTSSTISEIFLIQRNTSSGKEIVKAQMEQEIKNIEREQRENEG